MGPGDVSLVADSVLASGCPIDKLHEDTFSAHADIQLLLKEVPFDVIILSTMQ